MKHKIDFRGIAWVMIGIICTVISSCESEDAIPPDILCYEYRGNTYQIGTVRTFTHYSKKDLNDDGVILGKMIETVVKDTILEGRKCQLLKQEIFDLGSSDYSLISSPSAINYPIVYEEFKDALDVNPAISFDGGKIYEYIDGDFILKYDFTLKRGDKFRLYNVKTHQFENVEMTMAHLEALDDFCAPFWRVTFIDSDCIWIEGIGANYGSGMIYDPDEKGYMCFDSLIYSDGETINQSIFDMSPLAVFDGRPVYKKY